MQQIYMIPAIWSVAGMLRSFKSTLHALQKDEDSRWNWYRNIEYIFTVHCVSSSEEKSDMVIGVSFLMHQSQQTGPSDQSEQSSFSERMGLERLILQTEVSDSLRN